MGEPWPAVALVLSSLLVGGALGFWIASLRRAAQLAATCGRHAEVLAAGAERENAFLFRLQESAARERAAMAALEGARAEEAAASAHIARLETELMHERRRAAERLAEGQEAGARRAAEFEAITAGALANNNAIFLDLAREAFGRLQEQSLGDLDRRKEAIDALVQPLKESIEKVDTRIAEIESARARAHGQLGQQLEQLGAAQARLQAEAARLSTSLRSTRHAGSWGELQLRRVVEMADMIPHVDFLEQECSGSLRPDMTIRLPGGKRIVVDAKAPLQSYREAAEAVDEDEQAGLLGAHAQRVRAHIDALAAKNYWEQFQPAPEFVVLFLPGDHFLTAALQVDGSLLERAIKRRVLLATPTTLIALLKAAAHGWRQETVSQNAEEICALGRQLYDRVCQFSGHLERVGSELSRALQGYNAAVGSFEQSVLPGARRFAELGAKGAADLAPPAAVEAAVREVNRRS